jgi:hypothetical protein
MNTITVTCLILTGLTAIGFYGANYKLRIAVDDAVAPLQVPERQFGYTAQDLVVFTAKSDGQPTSFGRSALELYRERVLLLDIGFAVALGLFCLAFWRLAVQQVPSPIGVWFCVICGTAGLLYGLFDVCEDIMLRALLQRDRPINNLEAGLASVLTRFKMVAICVSVVGVAVFLLLSYAFRAAFELMRR